MRFTTVAGRNDFARTVLYHLTPPDRVLDLAAKLSGRMTEHVNGRMWMGAHMRRGDCTCSSLTLARNL